MKIKLIVLIVLALFISGCEDGRGGQTEANDPFARFSVAVSEAASSFIAQTTNLSRNHDSGTTDLAHAWTADQQHPTNEFSPQFIWSYFQLFGSRSEDGDQALRKITLDVIEGGDAERTSTASQTLLLERNADNVTSASIVDLAHTARPGRTIHNQRCGESRIYTGDISFVGFEYVGQRYCIIRVLHTW